MGFTRTLFRLASFIVLLSGAVLLGCAAKREFTPEPESVLNEKRVRLYESVFPLLDETEATIRTPVPEPLKKTKADPLYRLGIIFHEIWCAPENAASWCRYVTEISYSGPLIGVAGLGTNLPAKEESDRLARAICKEVLFHTDFLLQIVAVFEGPIGSERHVKCER